ncbi:hypothetical protein BYT27DRAFT_7246560 [Phlegmacium glaucopus]|nr:hypothetical protein BYT27DRAFT_7246560 [Phlegmacium glaucopus]
MSTDLDNTYGAVFIGVVVAAALYGVSCVQTLYYFTKQNDPWYIKLTVTLLMVLDTINQVAVTHLVYTFSIAYWGNTEQPVHIWSLEIAVILTGVTALIVQSFLTMRIWRFSGQNKYLTGISMILVVVSFGSFVLYIVKAAHVKDLASLAQIKHESMAINILGAATDLLIAALLCILLHFSRTGSHKSDSIINRLILFSVNTGFITSIFSLASMVSILVAGDTFIYIAFLVCLGRLYTNSLLSTLNLRNMMRAGCHSDGLTNAPLSLRDLPKMGSTQGQNISIKIDTSTSKYPPDNDEKLHKQMSGGQQNSYGEELNAGEELY